MLVYYQYNEKRVLLKVSILREELMVLVPLDVKLKLN